MNIVQNIDDNILGLSESRILDFFFFFFYSFVDTKNKSVLGTTNELIASTKSFDVTLNNPLSKRSSFFHILSSVLLDFVFH